MTHTGRERMFEELNAMGGFWIGCNLMFASKGPPMTLSSALFALAFTTALPFAVYGLGRWIRGKRFERECRPLIHRLEGVLETMLETTFETTFETTLDNPEAHRA